MTAYLYQFCAQMVALMLPIENVDSRHLLEEEEKKTFIDLKVKNSIYNYSVVKIKHIFIVVLEFDGVNTHICSL